MKSYSLIIPTYRAQDCLPKVLPGLAQLPDEWEILVVDDGSPECPRELVSKLLPRARFLKSSRASGAAGARNHGALAARGEVLVFLDSDVVVKAETLVGLANTLSESDWSGAFGCYAAATPDEHPPLSRFRNLLHRYVHRHCAGEVASFWTGLGCVRREQFLSVGGFCERLSDSSSIEDVEFGARLHRAGHRILLDPRFEGMHLKRWTLPSMVRTDIFQRAVPWIQLMVRGRLESRAMNGGTSFRLGPLLMLLTLALSALGSKLALPLGLAYCMTQLPVCFALHRDGGWEVGLVTLPAMAVHHVCCWVGAFVGLLSLHRLAPPPEAHCLVDSLASARNAGEDSINSR